MTQSVVTGHTKYAEIAADAGGVDVSYYLRTLLSTGILEKRAANGKSYYAVADPMESFWFKYVSKAQSIINAGRGEAYYRRVVKGHMHEHMGVVFEGMARQYLFAHMETDELPFFVT